MNKKMYKALSVALGLGLAVGSFGACKSESKIPQLPDYSAVAKDYEFFAYSPNGSGTYNVDGVERKLGANMRTVEGYRDYKDSGLDVLMLTGTAGYAGEGWEGSNAQKCMHIAKEAGINKILLRDARLTALVEFKDNLVGEYGVYKTQEELTAFVKECMSEYAHEETLYGIQVRDEPDYTYTKAMGNLYRAIKTAAQELGLGNIFINLNLLPLGNEATKYAAAPENGTTFEDGTEYNLTYAYTKYINDYLDATGADRVCCDVYLFRGDGLCNFFYQTAQIIRKACTDRGIEMSFCLQSFEMYSKTNLIYRKVSKADMLMELYSLMGMGVSQFGYYTYHMPTNYLTTEARPETSTFIDLQGNKNNVYYYAQDAMSSAQAMSDIILNYEYQGGKFFVTAETPVFGVSNYMTSRQDTLTKTAVSYDNSYQFNLLKDVSFDNDVVFATELKDETNSLYMYMLQNVIDPANGETGRTAETIKATFDSSYTYVAELQDGRLTYVKLNKGVYEKTLSAGSAVYLIPLK